MGATGGALQALGNMVNQRAEQQRKRKMDLEDQDRQNQISMIDAAIQSGNLNEDQIAAALEQKKKLYPKEAHSLIDQFGTVLGHVFRAKKARQGETGPGVSAPTAAVPSAATPAPTTQPAPQGATAPQAATATPNPSAGASPAPAVPSILASAYPGPVAKATTGAKATVAGNEVLLQDRNARANQLIADMKAAGTWTPQADTAVRMQAQGFQVPSTLTRPGLTGKQPKAVIRGSRVVAFDDPLSNSHYSRIEDMPAEMQHLWSDTQANLDKVREDSLRGEQDYVARLEEASGKRLTSQQRIKAHEDWVAYQARASSSAKTVPMIVPDENGMPKVIMAGENTSLPETAVTPTQYGTAITPTTQIRTMAQRAAAQIPIIDNVTAEIDKQKDNLGPLTGRLNAFMTGKVGEGDPDYTYLKDKVDLIQTAMGIIHAGGRPSTQLIKKFEAMANAGRMDAPTLKAGLKAIREQMQAYAEEGKLPGFKHKDTSAVPPKMRNAKPGSTSNKKIVVTAEDLANAR